MIKIQLNGKPLWVKKGANLLEVIKEANIYIPSLCYLKHLPAPKHPCGLCVVKIEGEGIQRSCNYIVEKEISVITEDQEIKDIRKKVLENLVINHYGDCKAPCHTPCPGGLNIQGYIGFIAKGDFKASLALIKEKIPLPACVGRVCPRFCESICRRAFVDEAIAINDLKRFVADYGLEHGELPLKIPPVKGKKIAIIGAGPAGLSCAYFLRLKGYEVTIFEREKEPGGLLRYGIPSFKLPKEVVKKEIENIIKMGIEFKGETCWGKDFNLSDLRASGFQAIFIAVGARKEKNFGFPGEELAESALQFLCKLNKDNPEISLYRNKKVAILGCSYTAVETARVLRRLNCEVTLFYPRSRMEVSVPLREIRYAEKEGVKFVYVTAPLELYESKHMKKLRLAKTTLTEKKEIKILPETVFEEDFDLIFNAWGEVPSDEYINFGELEKSLERTSEGTIKVNPHTLKTSIEGIFAGGDFLTGTKSVIHALASGRRAADAISSYLEGIPLERTLITFKYDFTRGKRPEEMDLNFLQIFEPQERVKVKEREPKERIKDFAETLSAFTPEEARKEAERCLKCGCLGLHKCEFREVLIREEIAVAKSSKKIKYPIQRDHPLIEVDSNKCISCERCVRVCPYKAIFFKVVDKGKPTEYITFRFTEACTHCGVCVDHCPTGALTKKNLLVPYNRQSARAVKSVCTFCGVGCNLTVWVKNNTILEINGRELPPNYGYTCVKGRFGFEFYRSKDRLTKPLIRKNLNEPFKIASWNEALEYVAANLTRIKNKYGPSALGFLCSARASNEDNYLLQKIARLIFKTNHVDNPARVCHAPSVAGLAATVGTGAACIPFDEILKSELIFILGSNTLEAHPIVGQKIVKAVERGAKLIVADPRRIPLADLSNLYLPLRPGTNIPLLNGMVYVILRDELYNKEFVEKWIENFENYKHFILSEWDLARASRYTGLKPYQIEKAAHLYAQARSALIIWGLGVSEHRSGSYTAMAAANLASLCGFWGKPGCGAMPLRGQNNVQGACDVGGLPYVLPGYQSYLDETIRKKFEELWGGEIPYQEGKTLSSMLREAIKGKLKALYCMGYDVAHSHGNMSHVLKALSSLEFLVVQDIFMPLTGKFAHVVLPAASFLEKSGTFTNGERRVQLFEEAVSPPGDALPDWLILKLLAQKLGYNWEYTSSADVFNEMRRCWQGWAGLSHERLTEVGIQWPCPSENHPGTDILFTSGFPKGKIHLAITKYIPPLEEPTVEFPFILVTVRKLAHYNIGNMTRRAKSLLKLCPEPLIHINPEDAKKYDILEGSKVKVWNSRGEVIYKAKIDPKVPQGTIYTDFHFDTALTNLLVSPGEDELMETPEYKFSAVAIECLKE